MKSALEQNHTMRGYSASCSGSTQSAGSESDYQNLEFIADSEALLKISDKKPIKSRF
jgi:hypothetical protein